MGQSIYSENCLSPSTHKHPSIKAQGCITCCAGPTAKARVYGTRDSGFGKYSIKKKKIEEHYLTKTYPNNRIPGTAYKFFFILLHIILCCVVVIMFN